MIKFQYIRGKENFRANKFQYTESFRGQCFKCGSWKHLQSICPLSKCKICFTYGHDTKICPWLLHPCKLLQF